MRITFPIARLIGGSVSTLQAVKDTAKVQKLDKNGKPRVQINFGIAIPKQDEKEWKLTTWGSAIHALAVQAEPVFHKVPNFAWKVIDGDSDIPNNAGKVPKEQEGYAGHWIIWWNQGWAPKLMDANGSIAISGEEFKNGYYVQIIGDVKSNGEKPPKTPGLYFNPVMACLAGIGEIIIAPDTVDTSGVGKAPLPQGAKPIPPGALQAAQTVTATGTTTAVNVPRPPIVPSTTFMELPKFRMTELAQGCSYDQMIAEGWTDDLLKEHGMVEYSATR